MNVRAWVLVLAGGDGRRLNGLTRDAAGRTVPKQYCDFGTGRSLIGRALNRALALAPHDRVVAVVASSHREWWLHELDALPPENVIEQPANRGTAAGILLPLLHVATRDPEATVVVLPSDHHVEDEDALARAVTGAAAAVGRHPDSVVLLGITPDRPDTEYGWVLPDGSADDAGPDARRVAAFVEKPVELEAIRLFSRGAVWNSFMFAARALTLIEMFSGRMPELLASMRAALDDTTPGRLSDLYGTLPMRDFSREVLEGSPERLRVIAVPPCGWTDLGTPARLARLMRAAAGAPAAPMENQSAA